ncbi:hypothetical protein F5Y02DRAFT_272789 [Annulohypoxylon stygium]|nr:hypothetical protein F5Y02DRAFT_272789 [Annulohypoxylon stygium]
MEVAESLIISPYHFVFFFVMPAFHRASRTNAASHTYASLSISFVTFSAPYFSLLAGRNLGETELREEARDKEKQRSFFPVTIPFLAKAESISKIHKSTP